jgi:hypothetical protein
VLAWQQAPGVILYTVVSLPPVSVCSSLLSCVVGGARLLVFDDIKTLFYSNAPWYERGLAAVGIAANVFMVGKVAVKGAELAGRLGRVVDAAKGAYQEGSTLQDVLRAAFDTWKYGCGGCFPAGTTVAAPQGSRAIEQLHAGDQVLAENPATGKVEAERVQAFIDDGVKPLIALDLSDGSILRVTSNHGFWVDGGRHLDHAGWLEAGQLQPGDELRIETGKDVSVLAVHWNVGEAEVYTLTVANDHTFFVGSAQVLVHNGLPCNGGLGALVDVANPDPAADKLALRIGGRARVRFANDPLGREFDAVSDKYIAQAKPASFTLSQQFRNQAKATFEAAIQSGKTPYFQFDGPPGPGVLSALQRYDARYGVTAIVDLTPL